MSGSSLRILSPTAILGYGFPDASLEAGMARRPHAIAVDAGSIDGGPYYLGFELEHAGAQGRAFMGMVARDLERLLVAARKAEIPLLIGSAGFAGGDLHLAGTVALVHQIAARCGLRFRLATIRAELDKQLVLDKLAADQVSPLGPVPPLTERDVTDSVRIVAQMGVEPFVQALRDGAQVIVAGRANDPSMFAALPYLQDRDRGLAMHMGKILECGAIAADPGSGSDALLGTLDDDGFLLEALNPERRCTVASVAAHSLYEKRDPWTLHGPGGHVDLNAVSFEQQGDAVRVTGSRWVDGPYRLKIEGSKRVGFRTIALCAIRDPSVIDNLDDMLAQARRQAAEGFDEPHQLVFHVYGRGGADVALYMETVADTQATATAINGYVRSLLLHMGFEGRVSTAGNLAFPMSPLDVAAGPVYAFSAYHLIDEPDPLRLFPIDITEVGS